MHVAFSRSTLWAAGLGLAILSAVVVASVALAERPWDSQGSPEARTTAISAELIFPIDQIHDRDGTPEAQSIVYVVDASSGSLLASIPSGFHPWVVNRPSAGEVIIVDHTSQDAPAGRLRIVQVSSSAIVADLPAADLPTPIVTAKGLAALSQDERWLYVLQVRWAEGCDGDSLMCDRHSLLIYDLAAGAEANQAQLPASCAPAVLRADGNDGMIGYCSGTRSMFRVGPSGAVDVLTQFEVQTTDPEDGFPFKYPYPVDAGRAGGDEYYVVSQTGDVVVQDSDGTVLSSRDLLLGDGSTLQLRYRSPASDTSTFLAWDPRTGTALNAVTVDPGTSDVGTTAAVPPNLRGAYFTAAGMALALIGGDLVEFNTSTGAAMETVVDLPGESAYLQYGR